MGKRELLLIAAFVVIGVVVYQATAPPPGPGERGLSLRRLLESARREIGGNRALIEQTTTATHEVDADIVELRVQGGLVELDVIGEDRRDVSVSLRVESRAYDDAEATQFARETVLHAERAANSLGLRMTYPRGGRQRGFLTLRVPSRLRLRVESGTGRLAVAGVAAAEMPGIRGDTRVANVPGPVTITHRAGPVAIETVGSLRFTGRGSEVTVGPVAGDAAIRLEQGGALKGSGFGGAVEVDTREADVTLEGLAQARGTIRVNATGGRVTLDGVISDTRVDARRARIDVTMQAAAPLAIYNDGDGIALTLPPSGYSLDATAVEGRISPDTLVRELGLEYDEGGEATESRAAGTVGAGGPTITIRARRGDLLLRPASR